MVVVMIVGMSARPVTVAMPVTVIMVVRMATMIVVVPGSMRVHRGGCGFWRTGCHRPGFVVMLGMRLGRVEAVAPAARLGRTRILGGRPAPALAFQLKARCRQQFLQTGLATLRAFCQRRIRNFLQCIEQMATVLALVVEYGHAKLPGQSG